jgi:hypothetical protein
MAVVQWSNLPAGAVTSTEKQPFSLAGEGRVRGCEPYRAARGYVRKPLSRSVRIVRINQNRRDDSTFVPPVFSLLSGVSVALDAEICAEFLSIRPSADTIKLTQPARPSSLSRQARFHLPSPFWRILHQRC